MFTYTNVGGWTIQADSLASALDYATMAFDACGFLPIINDANGEVAYAIDACGIAYATNMTYPNSSLNDYFERQGM